MDCPWSHMAPANLRFCEEPLCALVTEPANHGARLANGHALWHLLGALSFAFWYRHYAQFVFEEGGPP